MNSGFARAIVPYLQNLDLLMPRIDYKKEVHDIFYDTKGKELRGQFQRVSHLFGHQVRLSLI